MDINEIKEPFASKGERGSFSYEPNAENLLSWLSGFTYTYELKPSETTQDPYIKRTEFNELLYLITAKLLDISKKSDLEGLKVFNPDKDTPALPATDKIITFGSGGDFNSFVEALNYASELRSKWGCSKIILRAKAGHVLEPYNWDGDNNYCLIYANKEWLAIDSEDKILRCNGSIYISNISTQHAKIIESGNTRTANIFFNDLQIINTSPTIKNLVFHNVHLQQGGTLNTEGFSVIIERSNVYFANLIINHNNKETTQRALTSQCSKFLSANLTLKNINLQTTSAQVAYYNISHVSVNRITLDNITSLRNELILLNNTMCYNDFNAFLNMQSLNNNNVLFNMNLGSTLTAREADVQKWKTATGNKIFINQAPNTLTNKGLFLYAN